jgi:molybdate transport system substrate-binding protein
MNSRVASGQRRSLLVLLLVLASVAPLTLATAATPNGLTVFAAVSLTDALKEVSDVWTKANEVNVRLSFAASSALARQIEAGAHADVFFSADTEWIDYLQARKLLDSASRRNVLSNRLVLIAPASSQITLQIAPNFPLAETLADGRLATGDPDSVPVGRYARSALTALGVWNGVADRIVHADNVRVALAYVARGEATLGIVYQTDAFIEKNVRVVDVFPANAHLPILYPIALTRNAPAAARKYLAFVTSNEAAAIFKKYGFTLPR